MKQESPSTFVLNRNDKQYFFVEGKISRLHGPMYHVYYKKEEKPISYKAENFVEVHGLDEKQKISTFTEQALLNLRVLVGMNDKAEDTYKKFYDVYTKVKNGNDKKPNFNSSLKNIFVEALEDYNQIKDSMEEEVSIPFEENYNLVNSHEREKVMSTTSYALEDEIVNEKGLQRVLKKAA